MSMMGQIATLSDQLATMPDNMLGRIAQQYKNDAVSLSLILNEKNRREKLRMAQAGQAGQQPAPKVNDQVIASMAPHQLPENVGIGALPAPNMEHMAAGGLVAFADGGEVEHYEGGGWLDKYLYGNITPAEKARIERIQAEAEDERNKSEVEKANAKSSPDDMDARDRQLQQRKSTIPNPYVGVKPAVAAPPAPAAANTGVASLGAAQPAVNPFSMDALRQQQQTALGDQNYQVGAMRNQLVGMNATMEQQAADRLANRQKEIEAEGDIYKGRSDRIAAREAELGKQKDSNTGLAFLNAGLAIMSTPGSLATAIGRGAQVGTAQYASGLEKLRAAQERLEDAKDRTEELRLNRSDMNKREIRQLERERDTAVTQGQQNLFGFAKDMYGLDRSDAKDLFNKAFEGQKTVFEQSEQTKRTNAQIKAAQNTPQMQEWNAYLKANGNDALAAGKAYRAANSEKFNPFDAYSKYLNAFAGKETTTPPMSFIEFAAQFAMPTSVPKGAKVYND